jgi:hypothetical protein
MRWAAMESMPNMVAGLIATKAYMLAVIPVGYPFGLKRVGFSDGSRFADKLQRKKRRLVGKAVTFEIGADPKTGKSKAIASIWCRRLTPRTNLVFPTSKGVEGLRAFREEPRNVGI